MPIPEWLKAEPTGLLGLALGTLFPPRCVACRHSGAWLCPACIASIPGQGSLTLVPRLQVPVGTLEGAFALSAHVYPLREAVHALKYAGMRVLADPLSVLLGHGWRQRGHECDLLVPVPLHRSQLRRRGYNQAELLAAGLQEQIGLPTRGDILVRCRSTRSQVGLDQEQRLENVAGAFACTCSDLHGARVLLLDDVLTTGATMAACASALREAGASQVWGLALTYAVLPASPSGSAAVYSA